MTRVHRVIAAVAIALCSGLISPAGAQEYPSKTVRIVFGLGAGSSSDAMARIVADKLSQKWGQAVIVDNRPGATGNIAADIVSKSAPDGYTLLLANNSLAIAPSFYKKLNYDPLKDLLPVIELAMAPHVLCVNPALPIESVKDLIATAKTTPGGLMYSSAGQADQMAMELFADMAGIHMTRVPYKGGTQALQAVMNGEVALDFPGMPVALSFMKAGKIRCIAVSTSRRSPVLPNLPTLQEEGLKTYDHRLWNGIFVPAGASPEIINKISAGFAETLQNPDVIKRLANLGIEPVGSNPKQFADYFKSEVKTWAHVLEKTDVHAE